MAFKPYCNDCSSWHMPDEDHACHDPEGWIGVDLDGTLAEWIGWVAWNQIGPPIPAMVERIRRWLQEGKEVRIFTARVAGQEWKLHTCKTTGQKWTQAMMIRVIQDYTENLFSRRLGVTAEKDVHCVQFWDDRAVQVEPNTGRTVGDELRARAMSEGGAP